MNFGKVKWVAQGHTGNQSQSHQAVFPKYSVRVLKETWQKVLSYWGAGVGLPQSDGPKHPLQPLPPHIKSAPLAAAGCPLVSICTPAWRRKKTLSFSIRLAAADLSMTSSIPQQHASVYIVLHLFCSSPVGIPSETDWIRQAGSLGILKQSVRNQQHDSH